MPRNSSIVCSQRTRTNSLVCDAWNSRMRLPLMTRSYALGSDTSQAASSSVSSSRVHWPASKRGTSPRATKPSQSPISESQFPRTVTSHVSRVRLIASAPRGPLPTTSPRLSTRVMPRASMSARTASRAVTLPWTSEMTAMRSSGSATGSVLVGLAGQGEHPVERGTGLGRDGRVDADRVDDPAFDERLEGPHEVREVDAVHRRAVADVLLQEGDPLVRELRGEATHEVELGADDPRRAVGRCRDGLDDLLGRADLVGELDDLVAALGVHDHLDVGDLAARGLDRVDREPAVHRTVPAPQDHPGGLELLARQPAVRAVRVPDDAVVEGEAELAHGGVAAEGLVGQEEHLAGGRSVAPDAADLLERPVEGGARVGRGADRAAVATGERLDRGGGVHVRDGDGAPGHAGCLELLPAVLDLGDRGHVGHRAAGREVG